MRSFLIATCCGLVASFSLLPSRSLALHARTAPLPRAVACADEGTHDDEFKLDLLKLPRLTTPDRVAFDNFRERQRERGHRSTTPSEREKARKEMESMPLGMDPSESVDGFTRDLREDEYREPTAEEQVEAEVEYQEMMGSPAMRYKASLEGVDDLDIGGAVDDLLKGP